jgi:sulfite dehydrogenase
MRRRQVLAGAGATAFAGRSALGALPDVDPLLPAGTQAEIRLSNQPDKRTLFQLTDRPPNLETPIRALGTAVTPNDRFFVRYHLSELPTLDQMSVWSMELGGGEAEKQLTVKMETLNDLPQVDVVSVCQCSGNGRGLFQPHVPGVQWARGAVGCATWRGPRLRDVLALAGVKSGATEISFDGADGPIVAGTPDFRKSLPLAKAMADETIIATRMNGAPMPLLNGYPARLVVPGWTATYWMKHITRIDIGAKPLDSFWMQKAYRVPAGMFPVDMPFTSQQDANTWPITEIVVNSTIATPGQGERVPRSGFTVQGVAWDRGYGIRRVEVSLDDGKSWFDAVLGRDYGPYAFRTFSYATGALRIGSHSISVRATNNKREAQAEALKMNPAGYHNNMPHRVQVSVA